MLVRHSRLGASKSYIWLNCAGSVALVATLPKMPDTPYSLEGRAAHKLGELCLSLDHEPDDFVGRFVLGVEVTPDMAEAVLVYVELFRSLLTRQCEFFLEQQFDLAKLDPEFFGRNDSAVYDPETRTLYVIDYKHGAGIIVEALRNPQMMYYGLGALLLLLAAGKVVEKVVLCVVQPRAAHPDGPVRKYETDPLELIEFGLELQAGANLVRSENPPFVPGPWCGECHGAGACDALHGRAVDFVSICATPPDRLNPAELAERLQLADVVGAFTRNIKKFAFIEAQRGRPPLDYKLVETQGRVTWNDPERAMSDALRYFPDDVCESDLFKKIPITPRQFAKKVGEHADPFVAKYAKRRKNISLVPLSDGREEVKPSSLRDFEDIIVFDGENEDDNV
jgi:hypothetical protein